MHRSTANRRTFCNGTYRFVSNSRRYLSAACELSRKAVIDPEIPAEIPGCEFCKVWPVMQNWPQDPICKAAATFLEVILRQVGDYIFNVFMSDGSGGQLIRTRDFAAPTEPDPSPLVLERWPQYHLRSAGSPSLVARHRNAI